MTLRLRLVLGLVVLVLAGLVVFGYATYALFSRSQYDRLDEQLRNSIPLATRQLYDEAGLTGTPGPGGERPILVPFGTYAVLRDIGSEVRFGVSYGSFEAVPELPATISDPGTHVRLFTVGSTAGDDEWRVSLSRAKNSNGLYVLVAIPTRDLAESLDRFVTIELLSIAGLVVVLAAGSWLILRRGLRPLEQMATSTRSITAGDLSQRVGPADGRTEVGQLGLAMNTMLGELEVAFNERDATAQRLRQFLADASHELRTPLTSIQGFAELFRLGADHPDLDLPVVMRRIEEESARMKVLVEDLLLLARMDQARPITPTAVDLSVLAADACSDLRAVAPGRPVTLDAPQPVVVRGERDHLRQAIANLVTNAAHHTPDGTRIDVSVRSDGDHAVVAVRDHGRGLSAEGLQRAFDRFWQADSARVGAGSGLGLAIVAGIAREHSGTTTVANMPDGGALFTLHLPIT